MTHIILLDGKLWAFEPPEKPKFYPGFQKKFIDEMATYNRAYSLALEKKIEIDKKCFTKSTTISRDGLAKSISFTLVGNSYHLQANEPIKWEGGVLHFRQQRIPSLEKFNNWTDCTDEVSDNDKIEYRTIARLIAPVKEENSAMSYTEGMRVESFQMEGNVQSPTIKRPVPSEQENQEEIWKELFNLIEGPTSDRYIQAMKRFSITVNNNRP